MEVEAGGTRHWFDVDGASLVPDGSAMRRRPPVVLLHGGPGGFDHSYFKPDFARLTDVAQVVYLDLFGHGRSEWGAPEDWSFGLCADKVRELCETLAIDSPIVFEHALGAMVALCYGVRHPEHPGALVIQSGFARFDAGRIVADFRRFGGDDVAEIVQRSFGGEGPPVTEEEWERAWAVYGPWVPREEEMARIVAHRELNGPGMAELRRFDVLDRLGSISCPTPSASASSTPSRRWLPPARSPKRFRERSSRCSRRRATSRGAMSPTATGCCSRASWRASARN